MNLASNFILAHSLLHTKLSKRLDNNMSLHGISFSEFMILHQLSEAVGQSMRRIDLAESIGISASGVTRMLAPMEKIGLVEKEQNPRDARVSLVKLAKAGHTVHQDALATLEMQSSELVDPLTDNQLERLMKYTMRLLNRP